MCYSWKNNGISINSGIALHSRIENEQNQSLDMSKSFNLLKNDDCFNLN